MKNISVDIEDSLFEEIEKICKVLNEPVDLFVAAALEKHMEEKMKTVDSEETDKVLKKLQGEGEDEWM
jgi:hypothetical protein